MEATESSGKGPYGIRTVFGRTVNGPLGRHGTDKRCVNFIQSDSYLLEQFQKFCDMEFSDFTYHGPAKMSKKDSRTLGLIENSV